MTIEVSKLQLEMSDATGRSRASRLKQSNQEIIAAADPIISLSPADPRAYEAMLFRGEAYKKLDNRAKAHPDLRTAALKMEPGTKQTAAALLAYDLLIEKKDFATAITCLKKIPAKPTDSIYPIVMGDLAWAYYYSGDFPSAINAIAQMFKSPKEVKSSSPDETEQNEEREAEREEAYRTVALFFATAIDQKLSSFDAHQATQFLLKNVPAEGGDNAFLALVRAFVAKNLYAEVSMLTEDLKEARRLTVSLRFQIQLMMAKHYVELKDLKRLSGIIEVIAADYRKMDGSRGQAGGDAEFQKGIKQTLMESANLLSKSPKEYYNAISSIYSTLFTIPGISMEQQETYHQNMGEFAFNAEDFGGAAFHYLWVTKRSKGKKATDNLLRAISAEYQALKRRKLIPSTLTPIDEKKAIKRPLDGTITEWLTLIETYAKYKDADANAIKPFKFEMCRVLYEAGYVSKALEGFKEFAYDRPPSALSGQALGILIDTAIAGEQWETVYQLATGFLEEPSWEKSEIHQRLEGIGMDALFQLVSRSYKAHKMKEALAYLDDIPETFADQPKMAEINLIAAYAALALNDREKASAYLASAKGSGTDPMVKTKALLSEAALFEESHKYKEAATRYLSYFSVTGGKSNGEVNRNLIRAGALRNAWLSGDPRILRDALKSACDSTRPQPCDRYRALSYLHGPDPSSIADKQWGGNPS